MGSPFLSVQICTPIPTRKKTKQKKLTLQKELIHISQMKCLKLRKLKFSHFESWEDSIFSQRGLDTQLMKPVKDTDNEVKMMSSLKHGIQHASCDNLFCCKISGALFSSLQLVQLWMYVVWPCGWDTHMLLLTSSPQLITLHHSPLVFPNEWRHVCRGAAPTVCQLWIRFIRKQCLVPI